MLNGKVCLDEIVREFNFHYAFSKDWYQKLFNT